MYCNNCGKENSSDNTFCEFCGCKLRQAENTEGALSNQACENAIFGKKKTLIICAATAVAILMIIVVCIVLFNNSKKATEYDEQINAADKYMVAVDYDKAEAGYMKAININPKRDEAYIKAADMYVIQQKYEEAEKILETGKKNTSKSSVDKKLKQVKSYGLYGDYIENTLIPEYGIIQTNEQCTSYTMPSGLISTVIEDFNGDEIPEMLTVKYGEGYNTEIILTLYTYVDGELRNISEVVKEYDDLDYSAGSYNVFIKRYKGNSYIVISSEKYISYGCTKEIYLYELNDSIRLGCTLQYDNYEVYYRYTVNNTVVVEYSGDSEFSYPDESVISKGMDAFSSALKQYGIGNDRITFSSEDSWIKIKTLSCDMDEESEQNICYIQHGIYVDDNQVDLTSGEMRYFIDYSGLTE